MYYNTNLIILHCSYGLINELLGNTLKGGEGGKVKHYSVVYGGSQGLVQRYVAKA